MNTQTLDSILRPAFDDAAERVEFDWETHNSHVETVEHVARDGFIPFTDGGLRIMAMTDLYSCWGSGSFPGSDAIRADLSDTCDRSIEDALDAFIDENPQVIDICGGRENVSYHDLYDRGHGDLAEQLSETESQWLFEGSEFWIELRAQYYAADNFRNQSGRDEIWFCVGINTDYTYGRDKGLQVIRELTVPAARLTPKRAASICSALTDLI